MHDDLTRSDAELDPDATRPDAGGPLQQGLVLLERYRVIEILGRGGMGVVYRCHDTVAELDVALKLIPPEIALNPAEMREIRDNFRLIQRLNHPHIANLKNLEKDRESGRFVIVMEYVEGPTLLEHRKRHGGTLNPGQAIPLLRQLASALDYGHAENVMHRDIKPANVIVTPSGAAKLLDYGIAGSIRDAMTHLTGQPVKISGTAPYMAPEQWQGRRQDGRTDQYAMGVLAYELLTGNLPFSNAEPAVMREVVLKETVSIPAGLSKAAGAVLGKVLAKEPGQRYASCTAFVDALAAATADPHATIRLKQKKRKRVLNGWFHAAGTLASVIGLAGFFMSGDKTPEPAAPPNGMRSSASATPALPAVDDLRPRYHALVVGISDYQKRNGAGWDPLRNARRDAEAVGDLLEKEYGFSVTRLLDRDASRDAMMVALDRLSHLSPDDALLIYFAGHGYYEEALDEGYWIPADARMRADNRLTKEDWIWNSTITKLIASSPARHILVLADSCYSGSLFRGPDASPPDRRTHWYRRALKAPSRYLITSGNLEPVLDSGSGHSIFARQVLNYLAHPEKDIFSASDLGQSIRDRVSALTGQLVRMGTLRVASDAGGEFVFLRGAADVGTLAAADADDTPAPTAPAPARATAQELVKNAVLLARQGATNSAWSLLHSVESDPDASRLVELVKNHLSHQQRQDRQASLQKLIDRLANQKAVVEGRDNTWADYARPRILASIGPFTRGRTDDDEARALMYRLLLSESLASHTGVIAIEREALESVLAELDIGTSDLADPRAQTEAGKLLPAGILILGDIIPTKEGDRLSLRLVDTATSRLLGAVTETNPPDGDMQKLCARLAAALVETAIKRKPLTATVLELRPDGLIAGSGHFQGAQEGDAYEVLTKPASGVYAADRVIGTATVVRAEEMWSEFSVSWSATNAPALETALIVRERRP